MWDLEDSYSDSQASAAVSKEDDQKASQNDTDSLPDSLLCLICNQSFDSPETSQKHVLNTLHESFEMIDQDVYVE